MPMPIKIDSTDAVVTPLFDMQHKETLHCYRKGMHRQIESEQGLYPVRELVYFLQRASRTRFFERKPAADIFRAVGYRFGYVHGGILTPEKTLRPDVFVLVSFDDNQDALAGYRAGREWFFYEANADERTMTDEQVIERLRELTKDAPNWHDPEGVWFFSVGCLLGDLSGHLFPLTEQEQQQWEAAMKAYLAAPEADQESQSQEMKQVTSAPTFVVEYTG